MSPRTFLQLKQPRKIEKIEFAEKEKGLSKKYLTSDVLKLEKDKNSN